MKKDSFLPILISLLIVSCQSEIDRTMNQAESLLQQSPDSALTLLEYLPRKEIKTKGRLARFALLKSAALDKNYIDVTSDSLSSVAIGFYYGRNNKDEMLAWYYHALVQRNALSYTSSIVSLEKAERIAGRKRHVRFTGNQHVGMLMILELPVQRLHDRSGTVIVGFFRFIRKGLKPDRPIFFKFVVMALIMISGNNRHHPSRQHHVTLYDRIRVV